MERYEIVKDIGSGNFGVAKLVKDKWSGELFAIKFIERGQKIDEHVQREIMNHRSLKHPNIIRFKEVLLTPNDLAIVMEYAAGGELFERICNAGRFSEDEARYFFQQLISGVSYCHSMQICHRDLKLENTLLDGSSAPRLKICDFGYSKANSAYVLHGRSQARIKEEGEGVSHLCCIPNRNQLLEHRHTLHRKSCQEKGMMARLRMFGHVGLPCMSCLLVLIPLKIQKIQEISEKHFRGFLVSTIQFRPMYVFPWNADICFLESSLLTRKRE